MKKPLLDTDERAVAPARTWRDMGESEHFVQFYEADDYLLNALSGFIATGLSTGEGAIVIATREHRTGLNERLRGKGLHPERLIACGQYTCLDATAMLPALMLGRSLAREQALEIIGKHIEHAEKGRGHVRVFGELVALLWKDRNPAAAVELEALWNELQARYSFSLFCAYPAAELAGATLGEPLAAVCDAHSHVIPAESYSSLHHEQDRLRAVAHLQQKAYSLDVEIAERQAATERFHCLAESMPHMVFTVTSTGKINYCNKRWSDYAGRCQHDVDDCDWTALIHPDDSRNSIRLWRSALDSGEPCDLEHRLRRWDGVYRWHLTRATVMQDVVGHVPMWILTHTDIHDQRQRESTRDRSVRLRDEFLAAISHDLKTPLTILQGQAQVLQRRIARGALDESTILTVSRQIEHRSRSLNGLIGELLDLTQLRAGERLHLDRRTVDLVSLVRDSVAGHQDGVADRQIAVVVTEPGIHGLWDRTRLERVVDILVGNAIKHSAPGSVITVTLSQSMSAHGPMAVLAVEDHGIGIPHDDLPHIFEWFYRCRNAIESVGAGLGLAGVAQVVQQHGGTINVESQETVGTTVTVTLPVDVPAPIASQLAG